MNEEIFKDENNLNTIIRGCVKGHIKSCVAELLQGKDFRDFMKNKIMEQIGMGEQRNDR